MKRAIDIIQLSGVGAIVAGAWLVHPAIALVAGGLGCILWAEGMRHR